MRKYERNLKHFAQFPWSWLLINNVETTHSLIFKQDQVSIKAIYVEVKRFVSLPFWKFQEPKIKIKQNWVHPKSKGQNPYFAKEKTYSVQTGLTKTKETKEIQRDEDEDSSSGSTNSGPLWPSYRKCQAGQQLWSVSTNHWRVGTLSITTWKLLSKEMCRINIANICFLTMLSLVSRSAASWRSAIVSQVFDNQFILTWIGLTQDKEVLRAKVMDGQRVMEKEPKQFFHEGFPQREASMRSWGQRGRRSRR